MSYQFRSQKRQKLDICAALHRMLHDSKMVESQLPAAAGISKQLQQLLAQCQAARFERLAECLLTRIVGFAGVPAAFTLLRTSQALHSTIHAADAELWKPALLARFPLMKDMLPKLNPPLPPCYQLFRHQTRLQMPRLPPARIRRKWEDMLFTLSFDRMDEDVHAWHYGLEYV